MGFDAVDRQFQARRVLLECACCGSTNGVEMERSCTAYPFDGKINDPDDPNRPIPLCRACAPEHYAHWDAMWADYRAGLW